MKQFMVASDQGLSQGLSVHAAEPSATAEVEPYPNALASRWKGLFGMQSGCIITLSTTPCMQC
jgi:hypothetical protein